MLSWLNHIQQAHSCFGVLNFNLCCVMWTKSVYIWNLSIGFMYMLWLRFTSRSKKPIHSICISKLRSCSIIFSMFLQVSLQFDIKQLQSQWNIADKPNPNKKETCTKKYTKSIIRMTYVNCTCLHTCCTDFTFKSRCCYLSFVCRRLNQSKW